MFAFAESKQLSPIKLPRVEGVVPVYIDSRTRALLDADRARMDGLLAYKGFSFPEALRRFGQFGVEAMASRGVVAEI